MGVIYDLLCVVRDNNNSIKPTPLLRMSNLSSQSFNDYITELLEKGFVKEMLDKKERKFYTLSDKGFNYIKKYGLILGFIDEFEL